MSRLLLIGAVVVVMSGVWTIDAMAQRDAGAKARGEFGTGFWSQQYQRPNRASATYQPRQPSGESYRRASHEPIGIRAGDAVVVTGGALNTGAARMAAQAGAKRYCLFHFSPRYEGRQAELLAEARAAYDETLARTAAAKKPPGSPAPLRP